MSGRLSPFHHGIPIVASNAERAVLFPSPATRQRVQNLTSGWVERWDGAAWTGDWPLWAVGPLMSVNVKEPRFGAQGDDSTNDIAAFQAAHDALPTEGGIIEMPKGIYRLGSDLEITKPVIFRGAGRKATWLKTTSATSNVLDVACFEPCVFQHFSITSSVTRTAGAGIRLQGEDGEAFPDGANRYSLLDNLSIANHYIGVDFVKAYGWTMRHCYIVDNEEIGVRVDNTSEPDAGDAAIDTCTFDAGSTTPTYAILQLGSSGLRIDNTKVLNHDYGYYLDFAAAEDLSILSITGSSFETQTVAAIYIRRSSGSSLWSHVIVANNQFSQAPTFFELATSGSWCQFLTLSGNTIILPVAGGTAFKLTGGAHGTIEGNTIIGQGGTSVGIDLGAGTTNIQVGINAYSNLTTKFTDAGTNNGLAQLPTLIVGTSDIGGSAGVRVGSSGIATTGDITAGHTSNTYGRIGAIGGATSAEQGFVTTDVITDATQKLARYKGLHYTNAEEPCTGVFINSTVSATAVNIAGGSGAENAATEVNIHTAANNTTTSGTVVGKFDNSSTATHTRFLVYDVDNATLERVTVGAADSGGAGFKVLRIPN